MDRLFDQEGQNMKLITEEKKVLKRTIDYFQNQFQKKKTNLDSMTKEWKEIYKPMERIEEDWYAELISEITLEEWSAALKESKNTSAPGPSGIGYRLIKQAGLYAQVFFRQMANKCLIEGNIPDKWKMSQLYLIPKSEEWEYTLSNARPIALLESFRKCVTRILNKRLAKVFVENEILKGPNFAGLPGGSTENPIHIMNMLMKDTK